MRAYVVLVGLVASLAAGCASSVDVEQERAALLAVDREWAQTAKDPDKFVSFMAPDASLYPPGMPVATGTTSIKDMVTKMMSGPGFSLAWTPTKADVTASGDLGYTVGTYKASMAGVSESGKYVTVWKKQQAGGAWKVMEDIFNADAMPQGPTAQHVMIAPTAIKWGDAPPGLPPGGRVAVISGDPTQAGPFVIRAQFPAGYRIAPHWHPTEENLTILSGTVALGMGEKFDQAAMTDLAAGGYTGMPPGTRHYLLSKTAATIQVDGTGPFAINYVNTADDPRKTASQ